MWGLCDAAKQLSEVQSTEDSREGPGEHENFRFLKCQIVDSGASCGKVITLLTMSYTTIKHTIPVLKFL